MKTMLSLVLLTMSLICMSAQGSNPASVFTLQGKFISEHSVQYDVYTINTDSTLELVSSDCALKFFNIEVEVGKEYVIKFVSRDGLAKYLYVDVTATGGFGIDVDFNRNGSARLSFNPDQGEYKVVPLETTEILYVQKG
jgi:hypothetical protein